MAQPSPKQMFEFYKARLTAVFTEKNPSGLKTVDSLLKQFPGKEHQVYTQICKMCKVEPLPPATPADFLDTPEQQIVKNKGGEVSAWLRGHGFDRYSSLEQFLIMPLKDFLSITTPGKLIEIGVIPKHAQLLLTEILKEGHTESVALSEAQKPAEKPLPKADFEVGENCFTKVMLLNSKGGEKWLNARVTHINNNNTFDIFVLNAATYGVPPDAVNVPRKMLKKANENVEVAVPDPKRKSSKRPQFQPGNRVRVFGLSAHTSYNGLFGTVLSYVPTERRYQVRLDTNDVIAIKQRNVAPALKTDAQYSNAPPAKKYFKRVNTVENEDAALSALMLKLIQDNPETDAGKLGEFAAGYLLSRKKLITNKKPKD